MDPNRGDIEQQSQSQVAVPTEEEPWQAHLIFPLLGLPMFLLLCAQGSLPRTLVCQGWSDPTRIGMAVAAFAVMGWLSWEFIYWLVLAGPRDKIGPKGSKRALRGGLYALWSMGAVFAGLVVIFIYIASCH